MSEQHVFKKGEECTVNGAKCEFESRKGGWSTVYTESGHLKKVRNSDVRPTMAAVEADRAADAKAKGDKPKRVKGGKGRGVYDGDVAKLKRGLGKTAGGFQTLDKDDAAARKLRGLSVEEAIDIVARAMDAEGMAESITAATADLNKRFAKLNPGLARMSLGNILRGCLNAKK